jgi:hypothetical protein
MALLIAGCEGPRGSAGQASAHRSAELVALESAETEDLGQIGIDELAERTIRVKNISGSPVRLRISKQSCACINAVIARSELRSNEGTEIRFGTVVSGGYGMQRQSIELEASMLAVDGEPTARQTLIASLVYTPDLEFLVYPTELALNLVEGQSGTGSIYVRPHALDQVSVTSPVCSIRGLTVSQSSDYATRDRAVILSVSGAIDDVGVVEGFIEFGTSSGRYPSVRVPMRLSVKPLWQVLPAGVAIHLTPEARDIKRSLTLKCVRNTGSTPTTVIVPNSLGALTASIERVYSGAQPSWSIVISMDSTTLAGLSRAGSDSLFIRDDTGTTIASIPVVWYRGMTRDGP